MSMPSYPSPISGTMQNSHIADRGNDYAPMPVPAPGSIPTGPAINYSPNNNTPQGMIGAGNPIMPGGQQPFMK